MKLRRRRQTKVATRRRNPATMHANSGFGGARGSLSSMLPTTTTARLMVTFLPKLVRAMKRIGWRPFRARTGSSLCRCIAPLSRGSKRPGHRERLNSSTDNACYRHRIRLTERLAHTPIYMSTRQKTRNNSHMPRQEISTHFRP